MEHNKKLRTQKAALKCHTPSCPECGQPMLNNPNKESLHVIEAPCWKCGNNMKIALWESTAGELHDYMGGTVHGPSGLSWGVQVDDGDRVSENKPNLARNHGAVIKRHYSRTMGGSYQANTCTHCQAFVGANHEQDCTDLINNSNQIAVYSQCDHCSCGTCSCVTPVTQHGTEEKSHTNTKNSIKCGHCKGRHTTIRRIRECSQFDTAHN